MKKPFVFLIFVTFLNLSGLLAQNSSAAIDGSSNEEVSVTPCSNNLNSEESVSEKLPRTSPLMMLRLGSERSDNNSFYQDEEADREHLLQHERLRESIDGGYELIPLSLREEIVSDTLAEGMSEVLNENPLDAQLIRTLSEKRAQETMLCLRSLNTACSSNKIGISLTIITRRSLPALFGAK